MLRECYKKDEFFVQIKIFEFFTRKRHIITKTREIDERRNELTFYDFITSLMKSPLVCETVKLKQTRKKKNLFL